MFLIEIYDNAPCLKMRSSFFKWNLITNEIYDKKPKPIINYPEFQYMLIDDGLKTVNSSIYHIPLVELLILDKLTIDIISEISTLIGNLKNKKRLFTDKKIAHDAMMEKYPSLLVTANIEHPGLYDWFENLNEEEASWVFELISEDHTLKKTQRYENILFERVMKS